MPARPIEIQINVGGAEESKDKLDKVNDSTGNAGRGFERFGHALEQTGAVLAQHNRALGETVQVFARAASEMPRMIQQFGALGGAIAGVQVAYTLLAQNAAREHAAQLEHVQTLTRSYADLISEMQATAAEQRRLDSVLHGGGTAQERAGTRDEVRIRAVLYREAANGNRAAMEQLIHQGILPANLLDVEHSALSRQDANAGFGQQVGDVALAAGRFLGLSNQVESQVTGRARAILQPLIDGLEAAATSIQRTPAFTTYGPAAGTGGASAESRQAAAGAHTAEQERNRQRQLDEQYNRADQGLREQFAAQDAEAQQHALDAEKHLRDARLETEHQRVEVAVHLGEIEQHVHEQELHRIEEQRRAWEEAHQQRLSAAQEFTGPITNMFVGALSKTISGAESAGDAFKGMLAGFLELISQQAALKAAFEFAEAIATFPYGTAQHVAAGIAFTAVAVAAGVGAAAASPPAAPAAPSSANQSQGGGGGGGTTVIQWNSPIITVGDRAEVGRQIGQLATRGNNQYGATV